MSGDKEHPGPSAFGERIRQLRVGQQLLQKDVALRVGIDDTYLSKIENGRLPPPAQDVIAKLAAVLGVPPDELLLLSNREGEVLNFLLEQDPSRRAAARQFIQELAREERPREENRPIRRLVSKDDAREIAERATELLTKSKEAFSVDPGPPVPVELIAELVLGLRIDRVLRLGVSGRLLIDEKVLRLEAGDHERRQRFTIAHEVGHFLLHGASLDHRARAKGLRNRKREREANLFAAALLMPRESFKEEMRSCGGSLEECAAEMATRFNVSREAAAARIKDVSRRR
jgi:transcriptional regulator with XRE-family HTH domain